MREVHNRRECALADGKAALSAFASWFSDGNWERLLAGLPRAADCLELLGKEFGNILESKECHFPEAVSKLNLSEKPWLRSWKFVKFVDEHIKELYTARNSRHGSFGYDPNNVQQTIAVTLGYLLYWTQKVLNKSLELEVSRETWLRLASQPACANEVACQVKTLVDEGYDSLGTCPQCGWHCFFMTAGRCRLCLFCQPTFLCKHCSTYHFINNMRDWLPHFEYYPDPYYEDRLLYDTGWVEAVCGNCFKQLGVKRAEYQKEKKIGRTFCPACGLLTFDVDNAICCMCGREDGSVTEQYYRDLDDDWMDEMAAAWEALEEITCSRCSRQDSKCEEIDGRILCRRCISTMCRSCGRFVSHFEHRKGERFYCKECRDYFLDKMALYAVQHSRDRRNKPRAREVRYFIESVAGNRL